MPTGNGGQSNDSNNLSTANSGQCAESNEIVNCNVTDVNSQSIDNCSEMSTGNGGQSNSTNNLSTANSEQCAVSSESVNRSIELGGRSIVNNSEITTENSGLLIDNNGKSTGINERTVDGSTENSGKLISGNESRPTLNCNNNSDNGNRSTETSGHLIDNCSDLEINPTEIGGQITDHNDQGINNDALSMDTTPAVLTPAPTLVSLSPCSPEACFSPGPSNDSILLAHAQPPSSPESQFILDSQGELFPPDSPPRVGTEYRQRDLQSKAKKGPISRLFSRNNKKDTQEAAPIPWNLVPLDLPPVVTGRPQVH